MLHNKLRDKCIRVELKIKNKFRLLSCCKGIFCATGITTNEVIEGINIKGDSYISETLITHKDSNTKEIMKKTYPI